MGSGPSGDLLHIYLSTILQVSLCHAICLQCLYFFFFDILHFADQEMGGIGYIGVA